jgi:hypothetical protein
VACVARGESFEHGVDEELVRTSSTKLRTSRDTEAFRVKNPVAPPGPFARTKPGMLETTRFDDATLPRRDGGLHRT